MSYLIPTSEITLTKSERFRREAKDAGIARAIDLGIAVDKDELVAREAMPLTDFPGAWTTEYYVSGAPAAVGWMWAGDGAAVGILPVGRIAVFYKLADASANPLFTSVQFTVGPTRATTKAQFFFQLPIDNKMETDCYFTEPVVYDPQDNVGVRAYARAAGAAEELSFGCFIIEKLGAVIS